MARFNTRGSLGTEWAEMLEPWRSELGQLEERVHRMETRNRRHAWEWLATRGDLVLKADALDHAKDWSLVGCQDIAWVERKSGRAADRRLLRFPTPYYLAFQLGSATLAATIVACLDDAARLRLQTAGYRVYLRRSLAGMER
jgi:hypothetical protein